MIKDRIKEEHTVIEYIGIEARIFDPLTKNLAYKLLDEHVVGMGVLSSLDISG